MKAVRSHEGGVAVVEVDEPPGVGDGELLDMRATSVCASDLSYIRFGSTNILGHELAGVRSDGTPVVVEAIYGCLDCAQCRSGAYNLCPTHGQRALGIFADGGMVEQFRARPNAWSRSPRDSTCATPRSWSPPRCPGTPCAWPTPGPASGWPWSVQVPSGSWPWPGRCAWAPRMSPSKHAIPISKRRASVSGRASGRPGPMTS